MHLATLLLIGLSGCAWGAPWRCYRTRHGDTVCVRAAGEPCAARAAVSVPPPAAACAGAAYVSTPPCQPPCPPPCPPPPPAPEPCAPCYYPWIPPCTDPCTIPCWYPSPDPCQ